MRVRFRERTGQVFVERGDRWVPCRPPTIRQWADWSDEWETHSGQLATAIDAIGVPTLVSIEATVFESEAAKLNRQILDTLAAEPIAWDAVDNMALFDRMFTRKLLDFWWQHPLAPWDHDAPEKAETDRDEWWEEDEDKDKLIRTNLRGGRGVLSVIYRSVGVLGMGGGFSPAEVDTWEVWQVASFLNRDDPGREEREQPTKMRSDGSVERMTFRRKRGQKLLFNRRGPLPPMPSGPDEVWPPPPT